MPVWQSGFLFIIHNNMKWKGSFNMKKVFDGHCDVLYKMWKNKDRSLFFEKKSSLHASYENLIAGKVKVQTMAIFVPPEVPQLLKAQVAFEMIDFIYDEILMSDKCIKVIKDDHILREAEVNEDCLYIMLAMEGASPLNGDLTYLRTFNQLGVRSLGLTWNNRNESADGLDEPEPGGLSNFGRSLILEMNRLKMAIDITHLSENGFWNCMSLSKQPIMASHCNAQYVYDHRRNLTDEQIRAIYAMKGFVGINAVPKFLNNKTLATPDDMVKHVEHMLSLGGENYVGFGSDFDGISQVVNQFNHSGKWVYLIEYFQKHFSESVIDKLFFQNWVNYYRRLWRDGEI